MRSRYSFRQALLLLAVLLLLACGLFCLTATVAHAGGPEPTPYYDNITLQVGDTLWNLAEEYAPEKDAEGIQSYIKTLQKINGIKRPEQIQAGSRLTIVYYK